LSDSHHVVVLSQAYLLNRVRVNDGLAAKLEVQLRAVRLLDASIRIQDFPDWSCWTDFEVELKMHENKNKCIHAANLAIIVINDGDIKCIRTGLHAGLNNRAREKPLKQTEGPVQDTCIHIRAN
jgi:hypothetical protein